MVLRIIKIGPNCPEMGPKLLYVKLIPLRPSVLEQYFKELGLKITYLNNVLGSFKHTKVWN